VDNSNRSEIEEALEQARFPAVYAEEEDVEEAAPVAPSEPVFTLDQLKPYAEQLFGVGFHVLVGAASLGTIPAGKVTKEQVANGIEQYLNTPISKEA